MSTVPTFDTIPRSPLGEALCKLRLYPADRHKLHAYMEQLRLHQSWLGKLASPFGGMCCAVLGLAVHTALFMVIGYLLIGKWGLLDGIIPLYCLLTAFAFRSDFFRLSTYLFVVAGQYYWLNSSRINTAKIDKVWKYTPIKHNDPRLEKDPYGRLNRTIARIHSECEGVEFCVLQLMQGGNPVDDPILQARLRREEYYFPLKADLT